MPSKYQKETQNLINILKQYKPKKIILFGSAVSKKSHPQSDIDVCLIKNFKSSKLKAKRDILNLLWNRNFSYNFDPDIHLFKPSYFARALKNKNPFIKEINKGKLVYEK
ncbi:nucleotidyltransferase domain-containing protein [Candidatus Parcubacteria bacterium]|nr:nucleotidyltransferase domain-containing protein [Candidatus Parcubacteria bacterium]